MKATNRFRIFRRQIRRTIVLRTTVIALCGVFLAAAYLQNGIAGLLLFFLALFPQIFLYLAALFLMAAACSQMAETNHLAGGMQKKEYFRCPFQ